MPVWKETLITTGASRRFIHLLGLAQRRLERWSQAEVIGLTPAQSGVLFQLDVDRGALIGEVAQTLGVGMPGLSGLIDRMEAAGLVRRVPDPADGRTVRLKLTEQGRAARDVSKRLVASINARLFEGFSERELDVVSRWLTHVSERFKRDLEE